MRQLSDLAARGGVNLGPRGSDFTRAAMALAACEGLNDAAAYAANRWGATSRAANVVKAVISAVTSGSAAGTALVSEGGAHEFLAPSPKPQSSAAWAVRCAACLCNVA